MSFVSFAQNYEDVMLARAFAGLESGFYIDVGAQDPRFDSVTKAFYDRGWRGINLEPVAYWHHKLVEQRPRDINLCLAAGADEGEIELFEVRDSGLSTTSAQFARRHRENGLVVSAPRRVPVRRLDSICGEQGVSQVHFLKVDAEGAEADVLRGMDLQAIRPWVVLVEATEPNSRVSNHGEWESLLTTRGYRFVYDDGLNRFYLADEQAALSPAFSVPPNIFDGFVRRDQVDEAERLLQLLRASDALLNDRAAHIGELAARIGERDLEIARLVEAHHRDGACLQSQAAAVAGRDVEIGRLLEAHHRDVATLQEQAATIEAGRQQIAFGEQRIALGEQQIARGEAEAAALRVRLADLGRRLEQRDRIFERVSYELMAAQAAQLATQAAQAAAEDETAQVIRSLEAERREHARLLASRSWRITAPLRGAATLARQGVRRIESAARRLARLGPARGFAAALLSPFPTLARAVKRRLYGEPVAMLPAVALPEPVPLELTEDAEEILARSPVPRPREADR